MNPNRTSRPEKSESNETHTYWIQSYQRLDASSPGSRLRQQHPHRNQQDMLIAAGFKTITPKTAAQQQKLQALPPGQLAQITRNGQTYYVYPDAANNRAFVGGPDQYQALVNYRLS